ncbi:hypothetical protein [Variovorax sp. CF313]|uniref:hypothetical protein n=1 Tax=Variovorax sp. CF313 TaxID=1144315 RepID=UPI00192C5378|nr:hypothetical protein [Variovorax sp. CF313]
MAVQEPAEFVQARMGKKMNFHGRDFETVMGSDVQRDGMFLELREIGGKDCAEVFYSDLTHEFTVTMFEPSLPVEVLTWLVDEAHSRLPARNTIVNGGASL